MIILKSSDQKAIVYKDKEYTYNQLLQYSKQYAETFCKDKTPEKILLFAENSPEWIFAFFAAFKCGATVVPVDAQSTSSELAYIISDCNPDIIFTSTEKLPIVNEAQTSSLSQKVLLSEDFILEDKQEYEDITVEDFEKTMVIIYTSGTTGSPKGVMLTWKNIYCNISSVSEKIEIFNAKRNVMILLPLHHVFPLIGSLIAPLYVGATVYIAESLTAESILGTLTRGKIAIFIGVPRLYEILANGISSKINSSFVTRALFNIAKLINSQRFSKMIFGQVHKKFGGNMDYLVSGGASLPVEIGSFFKTLGFNVMEGYGMTETAPMISFPRPWNIRIGYAGEPLPDIEVKIDENGEVCVKGDNVMKGYYNRPEETAQIIRDGWLHTGDIGEIDKGSIKITGRLKDIIVTANGKNINPEELEFAILNQTNKIKELGIFLKDSVLQCIIVPNMNEVRDNSEDLQETFKKEIEQFNLTVAPYKRIKQFHLYSGELPRTRLMKVQRFKLAGLATVEKTEEKEDDANRSAVFISLKKYVESSLEKRVRSTDHFEIDLAMDSLERVALLAFIEESFGICMNEMQLDTYNNLEKLSEYVENNNSECSNIESVSWKEILSSKINFTIPKNRFIQAFCSRIVKVLMHIVYKYKKHGNFEMPNQPCIIVANHRSALDGYFITSKLKQKIVKNTFFFAKEKHLRSKFAHFMANKNNVILMDKNKNVRESLQQMAAVLKNGKNVVIFPEGTRSLDKKLLAFKDSFAILSKELNVPVVPVAIEGSERAVFNKILLPRPFAKISVDFLRPVYPQEFSVAEIKKHVRTTISNKLKDYQAA
ncbi:MAG: AMP-binding protein [Bacteroidales bacterium]|nr:AMP-binding protein [Bacteroidales bacterium]